MFLSAIITMACAIGACLTAYRLGHNDGRLHEQRVGEIKTSGKLLRGTPEWVRRQTTQVME